jgi:hypothetical protein
MRRLHGWEQVVIVMLVGLTQQVARGKEAERHGGVRYIDWGFACN